MLPGTGLNLARVRLIHLDPFLIIFYTFLINLDTSLINLDIFRINFDIILINLEFFFINLEKNPQKKSLGQKFSPKNSRDTTLP